MFEKSNKFKIVLTLIFLRNVNKSFQFWVDVT